MTYRCILTVFGLAASLAWAAEPAPVIRSVKVESTGLVRIDDSYVRTHTALKAGADLDAGAVSRDVKALLGTGRFTSVTANVVQLTNGVELVYTVVSKMKLGAPVEVKGCDRLGENEIVNLIGLSVGDYLDEPTVGVRISKVTARYRELFLPDAVVQPKLTIIDPQAGLARLTVTIQEGRRSVLAAIEFEGNRGIPASDLRKAFKEPSIWNPFNWFRSRRYDPEEMDSGRLAVRDLYMGKGYLDVAVAPPSIERDRRGGIVVRLAVREGPQYRFGRISLRGVEAFPRAELEALIAAKPGAIASADVISRSAMAVEDYYGSRGYADARVSPITSPDEAKALIDIEFRLREGAPVRIRNITVRGNVRTKDKVIRREVLVAPGDLYSSTRVRRSEKILMNLGYFETVRSRVLETANPGERDLVFLVEEKNTGNVRLAAGFSSIDRLTGFVEVSESNFDLTGWPYFRGGGQRVRLSAAFAEKSRNYEFSFTEPWFLDQKLSLGFEVYSSQSQYDDYDVERLGAAVTVGHALNRNTRLDVSYRLENTRLTDVADTNEYFRVDTGESFYFMREEDRLSSTVRTALTFDNRDNPFFPTRGTRASAFVSMSGGFLGADTELYRMGAQGIYYQPLWFGHVLSVRARTEVVEEFGGTDEVPLTERLYIGGGRTIRGFKYRDVGPKAVREEDRAGLTVRHHRPVGGRTLALASSEYSIPLVPGIRLAGFYDIGNVWSDAMEYDMSSLAAGAGVGIRMDIPGFPIRIDRAWALQKDNELTDEETWTFWLGYDY